MKENYQHLITFVWVGDLKRAKDFYTNTLGLTVIFESQGWVELSIPGIPKACLALNQWGKSPKIPTNEFITLGVENLKEFHAKLTKDDVHFKGDLLDFPEEGLKMFKFFDPDGNVLTAAQADA